MNAVKSSARAAAHAIEDVPKQGIRTGLGWASAAVGLTELLGAHRLTRMIGVHSPQSVGIVRTLGVRELMHAADLFSHRDPAPGAWSRVAGDMLDGLLLAWAATKTRRPSGLATVAAMVLPIVLADMVFALGCHRKNK